MKIPLSIYPVDDGILVYRNGQIDKTDYPFKPFVLAQKDKFNTLFGKEEIWRKIPEDEDIKYIKLEFETTRDAIKFKKDHIKDSNYIFSNSYIEQVYISNPDFFLKYPHTNDLTVMFFDIEVASKGDGLFPKAHTNEILCIGYSIWKYDNSGKKYKIHHEICKGFNISTMSDKIVIDSFFNAIQKWDPDILAGYNSNPFDLPYLIERAQMMGSDIKKLCRGGREPIISDGKEKTVKLPGRIHFDIYTSNSGVIKDQTLFNLKSKTLKDVSRWYKAKKTVFNNNIWQEEEMQDIEIKEHMENLLDLFVKNPELLYSYLDDDIYRTESVGHVYLRNCITLAELMRVSLESIIAMYSSFVPKLLIARNMEKMHLINTETNFNKYNIQNGTIARLSPVLKYEGAITGLYKDGYFPAVWKIDFASMYTSCIQTWNLGPDTTKLIRVEEYTGKYNCAVEGPYNWYRIPTKFDKEKYAYDLIVRVRNDKDGFLKQNITELKKERKKLKAELNLTTEENKKIALNSQQWAIKIMLNVIYGILGLKSTTYGDMISAVMVTAMCRWCSLKMLQRNSLDIVEVDTDGYIVDKSIDTEIENKWLEEEIKKKFFLNDNYMSLDREGEGERAYFYLTKNYVIDNGNNKYTIHGSSLKASKASKVVDRAIKLGIEYIFNNKPIEEVLSEAYDFKDLSLEDFTERTKLSKEQIEYDDIYDHRLFLAKQVEQKTGQIVTAGTQINYAVTKDRLPFPVFKPYYRDGKNYTYIGYVNSIDELDMKHYEELIDKALAKFGVSKLEYIKVNLFDTGIPNKRPINKKEQLDKIYMGDL